MKSNHSRWIPPGLSFASERHLFLVALSISSLLSAILFYVQYSQAWQTLFTRTYNRPRTILPDAMMPDFRLLLPHVLDSLLLLMLLMPVLAVLHYLYYRRGSMSIYLMRRLPDRKLLHQQCLTLPLLGLALCILAALLLLAIYFLIYLYVTPAQCLPPVYRRF